MCKTCYAGGMSGDTKYLRQRRGRWLVQVAVPKDLRERFGQSNVERYLRTSSLSEAKRLRHAAVAEIFAAFERACEGGPLKPEEIKTEAEVELRRAYDALAADFLDAHGRLPEFAHMVEGDLSLPFLPALNENPFLGMTTTDYAENLIRRTGAEPTEESVTALSEAILRAQSAAIAMLQRGIKPPPLQASLVGRSRAGAARKVSEAGERYLAERQRDPGASLTAQTAAQMRATFRLFADHVADAPLDAVTRDDAAGFLDTLARLHRHYGRRPGAAALSLAELLERYPAGDDDGLSNRTINRHQSALKTLFRWARRRGLVEGENPFADLSRPKARRTEWLPFEVKELNQLFKEPTFEVRPARHSLTTALPWIMAVALFSGMRQGEVCELDAEDVRQQDGVWFFDVTEAKSEAGVRRVPVHSALARLGFLKFVAAVRRGPLFPGIIPGGPDRKRAHTLAKRFPAFRRGRGVERERVAFHSFRKCFVRALEMAKVDRDRAALVIGHERGFTYRVYNPEGLDMTALREVVEAVRFPGLKLRHLARR